MRYDAILIVSFGGPERTEDVIPFLENVLRGRNVPRERMLEVAEHYYHFNGCEPHQPAVPRPDRALRERVALPVYWGNRNWHPMLADTVRQMAADGVRRALAIATSAYSSYSGCRQYIENIEACTRGGGTAAPAIDKLPPFWQHEGFVAANVERVAAALALIPAERRSAARLIYTAHSIPLAMAASCGYEEQLVEIARRVSERRRPRRMGPRLAKPQRSAHTALAGTRHSRPPSRAGGKRRARRGGLPTRLPERSHGSNVRSGS